MSIFNLARNLVEKPYLKRKLKQEMIKFDDTVKEMIIYENTNNYVKTIVDFIKENEEKRSNLLIEILTKDNINTKEIERIAMSQGHLELLEILPEKNIEFSKKELDSVKKLFAAEYKRPDLSKVENVAFSGGGAKGIAHVGTLRMLEKSGMDIKAVSGTSAGAIAALPFALGYKPNKVAEIVSGYDFTSFLQESTLHDSLLGDVIQKLSSSKRALMYRTVYFDNFVKEMEIPLAQFLIDSNFDQKYLGLEYPEDVTEYERLQLVLHKMKSDDLTLDERRLLQGSSIDIGLKDAVMEAEAKANAKFVSEIERNEKTISPRQLEEKLNLGFKTPSEGLKTFFRIYRNEDVIEEFFGDLIENKIKTLPKELLEQVYEGFSKTENIRKMSFKDFEKLREICPDQNFKNIGICICQKISDNPLEMFSKENYKQIDVHAGNEDPEYSEMPIKTAVRISMNLPGAFSSYDYKGKKYVDGGVRANFPLHFFDKTLNQERSKTLGFALAPEDNYTRTTDVNNIGSPETPVELVEPSPLKRAFKKMMNNLSHYYNHKVYGEKLDNNNPMDKLDYLRVGFINVLKVGTNDFNISKRGKARLMQQGYATCEKVLSPDYEAQINHYRERIKALHKKINNLRKNPVMPEDFLDELKEMNYSNMLEHESNPEIRDILKEDSNRKKQNFSKRVKRSIK